ncbi:hypothetical protein IAR50_007508 [Cryptococcus sp. DSM 104548]
MSVSAYTDTLMLFGDSLTQALSDGSFSQRMSEWYLRRADVVNRGFGGYTSEWAIPVFEQVYATKDEREQGKAQNVKLITIWLGANDACLPGTPQHVPVAKYKSNLTHLIKLLTSPSSPYYSPETKIILVTPPPVCTSKWLTSRISKWEFFGQEGEKPDQNRDQAVAKEYVEGCLAVAKEQGVEVVDLWGAIAKAAGGEGDEELDPYLYDGVHLTPPAYAILFEEVKKVIVNKFPELNPETMPMRMPHWASIDPENPRAAFEKVKKGRLEGEL